MADETTEVEAQEEPNRLKWGPWISRIHERERVFEGGWWQQADKAQAMFDNPNAETGPSSEVQNPFNVLYANTEVLVPALYSSTPRPDVRQRFKGGKKVVADAAARMLTVVLDDNLPGFESFDDAMESAVLNALVPGASAVRLRIDPNSPCPVQYEAVCHNDILWGYAKKWANVPWVAFRHKMTREGIISRFNLDEEDAKELQVPTQEERDSQKSKENDPTYVYELWIKDSREVVFLCEGYTEILLEDVGDVMQLASFYPVSGILMMVKKTGEMIPTPLYEYYRNQAEELNRVTVRLNKVLSAIKVRGAYNSQLGTDLEQIFADGFSENKLYPSQMVLDANGSFERNIWLLPIDKLIVVAQQLYQARESIKQVIYEITGLADIIRGASVASETATAQNLKNKWGSVRLKRMQMRVAMYARDLLRLTIDATSALLPPQQWAQMTQMQLPMMQEKMMAQAQLAQFAQQAQQGMPGQPPPQPPPQLLQAAQSPAWEEVLKALQNDAGRTYIIDIETDSTISPAAQADRMEVIEFLQALSQLIPGLAPLAQLGPGGLKVAKEILLAVAGKFRFGVDLEETLRALDVSQQQPPKQPDPADMAKVKAIELGMAADREKHQMDMQKMAEDRAMKREAHQMDMEAKAAENAAATHQANLAAQGENLKLQGQKQLLNQKQASDVKPVAMALQGVMKELALVIKVLQQTQNAIVSSAPKPPGPRRTSFTLKQLPDGSYQGMREDISNLLQ